MSHWESRGKSDDWNTPKWLFDALGCRFDLDPAGPQRGGHVPANVTYFDGGLAKGWNGFVWLNPPFGGRNGLEPWLTKFFTHGSGIALTPDRTSAPWFQKWAPHASAILFLPKVKFERPDGSLGRSPSNGTALMAAGNRARDILFAAAHMGMLVMPADSAVAQKVAA